MIEDYEEVRVREPGVQIAGRFIGIVVFLAGIALLGIVFSLAFHAFKDTDLLISSEVLRLKPAPPPAAIYVPLALRLVLMFIMGYTGSLIAARGAQMFFSAKREARRVPSLD